EHRQMEFRIGINLGDVIVEGERIYGDGVNIAARIESLAEAGGLCISGKVYEEVKSKVALGYEYLNRTTGHWHSVALFENTQAVRSERSRASGEVEEPAGRGSGGLRLRCATLRPNGKGSTASEKVYESFVVRFRRASGQKHRRAGAGMASG